MTEHEIKLILEAIQLLEQQPVDVAEALRKLLDVLNLES